MKLSGRFDMWAQTWATAWLWESEPGKHRLSHQEGDASLHVICLCYRISGASLKIWDLCVTGVEDGHVTLSEKTSCSLRILFIKYVFYQFIFVCAEKTSVTFITIQVKPRPQNKAVDCGQGGGGGRMGGHGSPSFTGEHGRCPVG